MNEIPLADWLRDPNVQRLLTAAVVIGVILLVGRAARAAVTRTVTDFDSRYRTVKVYGLRRSASPSRRWPRFFSERFAGFTVAFGVAGAGMAFALQELRPTP